MRYILIATALSLASTSAHAESYSSEWMGRACKSLEKSVSGAKLTQEEFGNGAICFGFVMGALEAEQMNQKSRDLPAVFCIPDGIDNFAVAKVFSTYLEKHPQQHSYNPITLFNKAMNDAFRCKKAASK